MIIPLMRYMGRLTLKTICSQHCTGALLEGGR